MSTILILLLFDRQNPMKTENAIYITINEVLSSIKRIIQDNHIFNVKSFKVRRANFIRAICLSENVIDQLKMMFVLLVKKSNVSQMIKLYL